MGDSRDCTLDVLKYFQIYFTVWCGGDSALIVKPVLPYHFFTGIEDSKNMKGGVTSKLKILLKTTHRSKLSILGKDSNGKVEWKLLIMMLLKKQFPTLNPSLLVLSWQTRLKWFIFDVKRKEIKVFHLKLKFLPPYTEVSILIQELIINYFKLSPTHAPALLPSFLPSK